MRVLVTGATGFVGTWLVRSLLDQGLDVSILRRSPGSSEPEPLGRRLKVFAGDVNDLASVEAACREVHTVFHLAGLVGYSRAQRAQMDRVNVGGTRFVLQACQSMRVKRLVHMSSVVTIGASFDGRSPLNEDSPYNLSHLNLGYFESKRAAEQLVLQAVRQGEVDAVILNPSTIYGAGDAVKGSRKMQVKVAQGRMPFYTTGGVGVVHIADVVQATLVAWQRGRSGERYILNSENLLIRDLFRLIAEASGQQAPQWVLPRPIVHAVGRIGDWAESFGLKGPLNSETAWTSTLYHWFDAAKARTELGLNPRPARSAIEESVAWMKEQGLLGGGL